MVRIPIIVSSALVAAVARADVSSSWTSISWSPGQGATLEQHSVVTGNGGRVHEQVKKVTSDGKVLEEVDLTNDGGRTYGERVKVAEDSLGNLHGKKDVVRCEGGWCEERLSILDTAGPGQELREHPVLATGWRSATGLRGAVPVQRVHVPCHRSPPRAKGRTGGFELRDKMTLSVADPEAFVADPLSRQAVAAAIAQQLGVDPKYVHVTLSVGAGPAPAAAPAAAHGAGELSLAFGVPGAAALALLLGLCLTSALLAPVLRRRGKAASWQRQLRVGSPLEALFEGEWCSGALAKAERTSEGYWVVQCDADVEGELLYAMDIRPAAAAIEPENTLRAALLSSAVGPSPVPRLAEMQMTVEPAASKAYVLRLYAREAVAEEARAVRAYTSHVVARALAA